MKKQTVRLPRSNEGGMLLDIVSYGRAAPKSLTREQREYVERTVRRVPEVMVKVSGGARTLAGVERNLRYIARSGKLGVESDTGERLGLKGFESDLTRDWNLDLEARARYTQRSIRVVKKPPKLVHNLIFSMPPGTRPDLLLKAVRKLAWNQFGFRHRHAMVLHTDEPHPHVHVVVKAVSEEGERLNIRKATLREWRREFAANLRELGVAANATERAVRGQPRAPKSDGIYRAAQRGESSYLRDLGLRAAGAPSHPDSVSNPGRRSLLRTRQAVVDAWRALSARLRTHGDPDLAQHVDRFVAQMPPVRTDVEMTQDYMQASLRRRDVSPPAKVR